MKWYQRRINAALLGLIIAVLFANPLVRSVSPANYAFAAQQFGTVRPQDPDFENVFTATPPASGEIDTLGPLEASNLGEIPPDELDDYILIGDKLYRIGDEFLDDSGITRGPTTKDTFGWYGYATIATHPEYKLIWYTDLSGQKHYMIVRADDELFAGTPGVDNGDGFEDYVGQLQDAEAAIAASAGIFGGGLGGLILAQIALCGPTAGATCVSGLITAAVAMVGAGLTGLYNYVFKMLPAEKNIFKQFELMDANRP
ncbi:MAG: hypothetical protein ACC700_18405 [Anaerolineales bacterium]